MRKFIVLSSLPLLAACELKPVSGENSVLSFRYDGDEQAFPLALSTPIAVDLFATIEVYGLEGTSQPASVVNATSSADDVAEVVATTGNTLTIKARSSGVAEIQVETALGEDVFEINTAALGKVDLSHPGVLVSDNPPSKAIVGGSARFFVKLKDQDNNNLVGFGAMPIEFEPANGATILDNEELGTVVVRFPTEGSVTLTASGDEPLTVEVIPTTDLVDLTFGNNSQTVQNGQVGALKLRGLTADASTVVGVASLAAVTTSTPEKCDIEPNPKLGEGAYRVVSKDLGDCLVTATLGALSAEASITIIAP